MSEKGAVPQRRVIIKGILNICQMGEPDEIIYITLEVKVKETQSGLGWVLPGYSKSKKCYVS